MHARLRPRRVAAPKSIEQLAGLLRWNQAARVGNFDKHPILFHLGDDPNRSPIVRV